MENITIKPYAIAAAHLYGVYHVDDFILFLKQYESIEMSRKDMVRELTIALQEASDIHLISTYVYDERIFSFFEDALAFYKKHAHKPFYYPTFACLNQYVKDDFVEVSQAHKLLAQYLKEHTSASIQEITESMRRALKKIHGDADMRSIMEEFLLLGQIKDAQLPQFARLLEGVMNQTRRCSNHGFTPEEMNQRMKQEHIQ